MCFCHLFEHIDCSILLFIIILILLCQDNETSSDRC